MSLLKKKKPLPPAKSVDSITAKLHDTVAELQSHADDQIARASTKKAIAADALNAADAHLAEHERATKVAGNIKTLLGV